MWSAYTQDMFKAFRFEVPVAVLPPTLSYLTEPSARYVSVDTHLLFKTFRLLGISFTLCVQPLLFVVCFYTRYVVSLPLSSNGDSISTDLVIPH